MTEQADSLPLQTPGVPALTRKTDTKVKALPKGPPTPGVSGAIRTVAPPTKEMLHKAFGAKSLSFNVNLYARTSQTAFLFKGEGIDPAAEEEVNNAAMIAAMAAFKPTDAVEAMIAAQAVALHNLTLETARRAQLPQQPVEVASKLRKDTANLARAMTDMVDALARHRGKGPQVVRVERVVVHEGAQAIVGNVQAGTPRALPQGDMPMATAVLEPQGREGT